ncbi:hypothetical protein OHS70_04515 [Streptomyces sp. NBC_00390]|uniref:hypothetical protein n=1 Tax=Streptomyces sp. NBC_00390 TaxID=2975736 RepID=UPI002E224D7A
MTRPFTVLAHAPAVTDENAILADILDRGAAETEPEALLGAVIDSGVFVPVDGNGSVVFIGADGSGPTIPGHVSEHCVRQRLPQAAGAVLCDVLRLLDMGRQTRIDTLTVFSSSGWATVPLALLSHALERRGMRTQGEQSIRLTWSTHPLAVSLRDALRDRLAEFPGIETVWIAHARWTETGTEQLMLHVASAQGSPADLQHRLMNTLFTENITLGSDDPSIGVRVLDPVTEADTIRELESLGLDTVRADHVSGRIEVVSREYDDPQAAAAARDAFQGPASPPSPSRPRRWWHRS